MLFDAPDTSPLPTFEQVMKMVNIPSGAPASTSEGRFVYSDPMGRVRQTVTIRDSHTRGLSVIELLIDNRLVLFGCTDGKRVQMVAPYLGIFTTVPHSEAKLLELQGMQLRPKGNRLELVLVVAPITDQDISAVQWKGLRETDDFFEGVATKRVDFEGQYPGEAGEPPLKFSAWITQSGTRTVPYLRVTAPGGEVTGTFRTGPVLPAFLKSDTSRCEAVPLSVFREKCVWLFGPSPIEMRPMKPTPVSVPPVDE